MPTKTIRTLFIACALVLGPTLLAQDYDYEDPPRDPPLQEYDEPAYQAGRPTGYAEDDGAAEFDQRDQFEERDVDRGYEEDPYQEREYSDNYDDTPPPQERYDDSYDEYDDY